MKSKENGNCVFNLFSNILFEKNAITIIFIFLLLLLGVRPSQVKEKSSKRWKQNFSRSMQYILPGMGFLPDYLMHAWDFGISLQCDKWFVVATIFQDELHIKILFPEFKRGGVMVKPTKNFVIHTGFSTSNSQNMVIFISYFNWKCFKYHNYGILIVY